MSQAFKKFIPVLVAVSLIGVLVTGCGGTSGVSNSNGKSSGQTVTMRIGESGNEESHDYQGAVKFKELVEKYSNGTVQVQNFPSAQLGNDVSMVQQLQSGALEATVITPSPLANIVPDFAFFDFPFLFKDTKVAQTVLDGPVGQSILDELSAHGIIGLAYWENGFRDLTNSKRPIKTLSDLQGIKLRVMQAPLDIAFWRALGANPTPMSFDQVFSALQQHVIDAEENPLQIIYASKFYEVQKYLTLTNHMYSPLVFLVSKSWWGKLTPDQQNAIKKAAIDAGQYERELTRKESANDLALLKAKGMEVDTLSDEQLAKWRSKVQPVIEEYSQKDQPMADKLLAAVKQAEASDK